MPPRPRQTSAQSTTAVPSGPGSTPGGNNPNIVASNNQATNLRNVLDPGFVTNLEAVSKTNPTATSARPLAGRELRGRAGKFKQQIGERNYTSHNFQQVQPSQGSEINRR